MTDRLVYPHPKLKTVLFSSGSWALASRGRSIFFSCDLWDLRKQSYSSLPLSERDVFRDPQWMTETADSSEPYI